MKDTNAPTIRVCLSIENRFLRESLTRLFRKRADFAVISQNSLAGGPPALLEQRCDVCVGDAFALNAASQRKDAPGIPRLLLIGMPCDEEVFLSAVREGVSGYLLQDASAADVVSAVRSVFRGESVCPQRLCATLFSFVAESHRSFGTPASREKPDLTLRQQQLLTLVAEGLTNKEIASRLNLSQFTVRNHIHRILKQVDAESRSEAVQTGRAHGYLSAPRSADA